MNSLFRPISPARYEPQGWMQWPGNEPYCFQFMKVLGVAQEGGSTISECFLTANRIVPGDDGSWYRAWKAIADVNQERARAALAQGHIVTAQSSWLRASCYYRTAEVFLGLEDARRAPLLAQMQACSHLYLKYLEPAGETVQILDTEGNPLEGYFLAAPGVKGPSPVVICIGGPDHFKEEHLYKMPRHAHARGLSVLLVDLPGQEALPHRNNRGGKYHIENSISEWMDYLAGRSDVDDQKVAIFGEGLGASFASRAASMDNRFAATVCDGGIWDLHERAFLLHQYSGEDSHDSIKQQIDKLLHRGIGKRITCPMLVPVGEHDVIDPGHVVDICSSLKEAGRDISLKVFPAAETAASPAQIDNPTIANEFIFDWIAARLSAGNTT